MASSARILAIDFGEKRVGLALSVVGTYCNTPLHIPQPLKTVDRGDLWKELDEIFSSYKIETVVVGLPLRTNGRDADSTSVVKKLAEEIASKFNVPVKLWDERFSTKSAERILRTAGRQPSRDKKLVDKIAAAIILEEYLSSL